MKRSTACVVTCMFVGLFGASACGGGVGPGDYVVYRVAAGTAKATPGCNLPADDGDSSTLFSSSTLAMYGGANEKLYLEATLNNQTFTMEGKETETGYSFTGKTVDVNRGPLNRETTVTTNYTVTMTLDGAVVTGTGKIAATCSGNTCPYDSCTLTYEFAGSQVDGAMPAHGI